MDQDRNHKINPCTHGQLIYDKGGKTNGAGKTGKLHVKKMELDHSLIPYTKISPKCETKHY